MCEIAEVYVVDKPRARKVHRCVECGGVIERGEVYHRHHGIFDGAPFSDRVCVECDGIRLEMNRRLDVDEQICVGQVCEAVFESGGDLIARFMEIKKKRGGEIRPWMLKRELEGLPPLPGASPLLSWVIW